MGALRPQFDELQQLLDTAEKVVVSGHERADGDAVGAVSALRRHLELQGRQVTALLSEPLNPRYGFMTFERRYEVYEGERHDALIADADVFIMCDLSSLPRLGPLLAPLEASQATTVCVDHHPCEGGGPGAVNLVDPSATATGCIVYDYIQHVGGNIDREIAESVFVSLCTDTGWFRYPNATPRVMELAAELAGHRLDIHGMYRSIYQANSAPMLRLLGHVTRTMNEECGGRFVWAMVRREFQQSLGVTRYDVDPILDVLRSGESVDVVALFSELEDGRVSVSLRSRGQPDMNIVARRFGGGGHVYSAGTTLPADEAESMVKDLVAQLRRETESL